MADGKLLKRIEAHPDEDGEMHLTCVCGIEITLRPLPLSAEQPGVFARWWRGRRG